MKTARDITGQRFNRLTAVAEAGKNRHGQHLWTFKCDCGKTAVTEKFNVTRGHTKSCGCARKDSSGRPALAEGEASFNHLFSSYKRGARIRGITFALTADEFRALTQGRCHYCGSGPGSRHRGTRATRGAYGYNGIDRTNNGRGYTPKNCVPCCKICNYAKRTITKAEFEAWIARLISFRAVQALRNF